MASSSQSWHQREMSRCFQWKKKCVENYWQDLCTFQKRWLKLISLLFCCMFVSKDQNWLLLVDVFSMCHIQFPQSLAIPPKLFQKHPIEAMSLWAVLKSLTFYLSVKPAALFLWPWTISQCVKLQWTCCRLFSFLEPFSILLWYPWVTWKDLFMMSGWIYWWLRNGRPTFKDLTFHIKILPRWEWDD